MKLKGSERGETWHRGVEGYSRQECLAYTPLPPNLSMANSEWEHEGMLSCQVHLLPSHDSCEMQADSHMTTPLVAKLGWAWSVFSTLSVKIMLLGNIYMYSIRSCAEKEFLNNKGLHQSLSIQEHLILNSKEKKKKSISSYGTWYILIISNQEGWHCEHFLMHRV